MLEMEFVIVYVLTMDHAVNKKVVSYILIETTYVLR